jgi:threonine dehydrogenase-like Zn-dependent dehydrogenase
VDGSSAKINVIPQKPTEVKIKVKSANLSLSEINVVVEKIEKKESK